VALVRVALTREAGYNDALRAQLREDVEVVEVPLTTTRPLDPPLPTTPPDGVIVSSVRAVEVTQRFHEHFPDVPVYAVGPATALALGDANVTPSHTGMGGLAEVARDLPPGRYLVIGALESTLDTLSSDDLPPQVHVEALAAYETLGRTLSPAEQATLASCDVVVIGAPSAWNVAAPFVARETLVVVPGQRTADAVRVNHDHVAVGWGSDLTSAIERPREQP
jgi:uroporphyrinogen-III synthase